MFESLGPVQRSRAERVRALVVPLVIGILIDLPLEIFVHWGTPFEQIGPFADFVIEWARWIYFPDLVLFVFDEDLRGTAFGLAIRVAATTVFYAAIVWWCRYWIEEGYIEGEVNQRLWRYWPFRIGMGVFVPFFILRIWSFVHHWRLYHAIQDDEEAFVIGFFMYLGGMTALLSAIIVIGRRIRAKREARESEGSSG